MRVTFILNDTPADDFAHWLEYHTGRTCFPGNFPVKGGQGEIFLKGPKFPGHIEGPTQIDLGVYYIDPDRDEGAYAAVLSGEVDETPRWNRKRFQGVFHFTVIPIGPDTKVEAWCGVPELVGFYKELLKTIAAELRLKTKEPIEKALGTPTPQTPTEDGTGKAGQRPQTPKGKRGKRSRYSQTEKDKAVMDWEMADKESTAQNLVDFLTERFGDDEKTWKPLVAPSTFYDWRSDFYKRYPDWRPNKP